MNTKILLSLLVVTTIAFSSCKEDEPAAPVKSKTELLTASPWITTSIKLSPGIDDGTGNIITDLFAGGEPCDNDDETVYKTDKTGEYNEGATKCDPTDPQVYQTFTWSFNSTETTLTESGQTADISTLNATNLVLVNTIDGADIGGEPGTTYTITATFKH